jgi:hypothetical protein
MTTRILSAHAGALVLGRLPVAPPPSTPAGRPTVDRLPRLAVVGLSVALYLVACATPALVFSGRGTETWFGIEALATGWLGIFVGQFAWFANPLLAIAWLLVLLRRWIGATVTTVLALLVAANTFQLYAGEIPGDEGGVVKLHFEYPHVGFAFWMLSMFVVLVGAVGLLVYERTAARP